MPWDPSREETGDRQRTKEEGSLRQTVVNQGTRRACRRNGRKRDEGRDALDGRGHIDRSRRRPESED